MREILPITLDIRYVSLNHSLFLSLSFIVFPVHLDTHEEYNLIDMAIWIILLKLILNGTNGAQIYFPFVIQLELQS